MVQLIRYHAEANMALLELVCIQVASFHKGDKQVNLSATFFM